MEFRCTLYVARTGGIAGGSGFDPGGHIEGKDGPGELLLDELAHGLDAGVGQEVNDIEDCPAGAIGDNGAVDLGLVPTVWLLPQMKTWSRLLGSPCRGACLHLLAPKR